MLQHRISAARECLARCGVDHLLFLHLPNIRYLSGFTGSDGALLVTAAGGKFLTDSRYTTQAGEEVRAFPTEEYRGKLEGLRAALSVSGARRVGFEAEHMTVAFHRDLSGALPDLELVPLGADMEDLRRCKDSTEVSLLSRCAAIASAALLESLAQLKPGVVERDIALALEFAMKRQGAEEKSFDFIVASGERGALPHGRASDKCIQRGELVTIDFGAVYGGYCSDETVTVAVGEANGKQREIYGVVKDAHDMAIKAVRPGVPLKELDAIARGHIDARGYGAYFGHGLGHGVGLEVHEKPTVSFRSEDLAEEGMVITIEPGIYIPGWGGVRIEDTVLVTADGCRVLTQVNKELQVV